MTIPKGETINCRSKKSPNCYDGKPTAESAMDPDGLGMEEDGTWDGESVVCDACYIAIGAPGAPPGMPSIGPFLEDGKGPDETQRFIDQMNAENQGVK